MPPFFLLSRSAPPSGDNRLKPDIDTPYCLSGLSGLFAECAGRVARIRAMVSVGEFRVDVEE